MYYATLVAVNTMRYTIHLDPVIQLLGNRGDGESPPCHRKPVFKRTKPFAVGVNAASVNVHAVMLRAETIDGNGVGMTSIAQCHRPPYFALDLGPAADS